MQFIIIIVILWNFNIQKLDICFQRVLRVAYASANVPNDPHYVLRRIFSFRACVARFFEMSRKDFHKGVIGPNYLGENKLLILNEAIKIFIKMNWKYNQKWDNDREKTISKLTKE